MLAVTFTLGSAWSLQFFNVSPEEWEEDGNMLIWFLMDHEMIYYIDRILYVYVND